VLRRCRAAPLPFTDFSDFQPTCIHLSASSHSLPSILTFTHTFLQVIRHQGTPNAKNAFATFNTREDLEYALDGNDQYPKIYPYGIVVSVARPPASQTGFPPAFQAGGRVEPPAAQSRSRSSSGPRPAPAAEDWQPPQELLPALEFLRVEVPVPGPAFYTLFFPIELTQKDYLRRVFDIVAMGIQRTVQIMIMKFGDTIAPIGTDKDRYDFDSSCDLYYLTKHIMDSRSSPVYARGQALVSRRIIAEACDVQLNTLPCRHANIFLCFRTLSTSW
jgi:hypothetical protein